MKILKKFCQKEVVLYLVFGAATTGINFAVYAAASFLLGLSAWLSSALAWIFAVALAFAANKIYVFAAKNMGASATLRQFALFFASRITSGTINIASMYILVDILALSEILMFCLCQILVIAFNFAASKWLIFKKTTEGRTDKKD